jgi:hypothetical protein
MKFIELIIITLLILSILTNLIMYHKYVINKDEKKLDPKIKEGINTKLVNIYYTQNYPITKSYKYDMTTDSQIIEDLKILLDKYQDNNKYTFYYTLGKPTTGDYYNINNLIRN